MVFINSPLLGKAAIKALISLVLLSAPALAANCKLIVPKHPLTAHGLATPYQLTGGCSMANADTQAFVEATIIDTETGELFVYSPLVITKGTKPLVKPVVPKLPKHAVVGIWFGSNADALHLVNHDGSLHQGKCVNGIPGSDFGQFAYCGGPDFFKAARKAVHSGKLVIPQLGKAKGGRTCPTTRAWEVVDQDQSDNLVTKYLLKGGRTAQFTIKNAKKKKNAKTISNGSDNALLTQFIDPTLNCQPFAIKALDNLGTTRPSLGSNELQAMFQAHPQALIPENDPMVRVNGKSNLRKINAYRAGVNMHKAHSLRQASGKKYCYRFFKLAPPTIHAQKQYTLTGPTPNADVGDSLFTFLGARYEAAFTILGCDKLLHRTSPITTVKNGKGVAIRVKFGQSKRIHH